jgi:hypothetical protein
MKCNDCLNLLEEYIDGEASERDAEQISAHVITCANCADEFEALTAEQEIYARYDRELEIAPSMWPGIVARTAAEGLPVDSRSRPGLGEWFTGLFAAPRVRYAFSGALAVAIVAVVIGLMYLRIHQQQPLQPTPVETVAGTRDPGKPANQTDDFVTPRNNNDSIKPGTGPDGMQVKVASRTNQRVGPKPADDPGVLFSDVAYSDLAKQDTAEHIQQAENLLRSMRSLPASDDDSEVDVTYEKAMSRRLLSENVVLRKDAEVAGKFPAKELLKDLEPFLIEIANLPDKTTGTQLREFKERVQKTEIVAALVSYDD